MESAAPHDHESHTTKVHHDPMQRQHPSGPHSNQTKLDGLPPEILQEIMTYTTLVDNHNLSRVCHDLREMPPTLLGTTEQQNDLQARFKALKTKPYRQLQLLTANKMTWRQFSPLGPYKPWRTSDPHYLLNRWPWEITFASNSTFRFKDSKNYIEERLRQLCHGAPPGGTCLFVGMDFRNAGLGIHVNAMHAIRSTVTSRHVGSPSKQFQALQHGDLAKWLAFDYLDASKPDIGSFEGMRLYYSWTSFQRFKSFKDVLMDPKYQSCINNTVSVSINIIKTVTSAGQLRLQVKRPLRLDLMQNMRTVKIIADPKCTRRDVMWISELHLPTSLRYLWIGQTTIRGLLKFPPQLRTLLLDFVYFMHPFALESLPSSVLYLRVHACKNLSARSLEHLPSLRSLQIGYNNNEMSGHLLSTLKSPNLRMLMTQGCHWQHKLSSDPLPCSMEILHIVNCRFDQAIHLAWNSPRLIDLSNSTIHKLPDLRTFHRLQKLVLVNTQLKDGQKQFDCLPECLRILILRGNPITMIDLYHLKCLSWIDLASTKIQSDKVKLSESVTSLSLGQCELRQLPDIRHLYKMKMLAIGENPHLVVGQEMKDHLHRIECKVFHNKAWIEMEQWYA